MGVDFAQSRKESRAVYEQASEILGWDVLDVCANGPVERLSETDVQQPAILVTSAAILAAMGPLSEVRPMFCATAGLSLGEYSALYFAGSLSLADAVRLVRDRGRFMQDAAEATPSSMVSLIGADEDAANDICTQAAGGEVLVVANLNCPGQVVISGEQSACGRAVKIAESRNLRAVQLPVAGAFHSPLMQSAADRLRQVLFDTPIEAPQIPVISNVSADAHQDVSSIRESLCDQVTHPVRWQAGIERLVAGGVDQFVEVGPNRILTGLMRKINRQVKTHNVSTVDKLNELNLEAFA